MTIALLSALLPPWLGCYAVYYAVCAEHHQAQPRRRFEMHDKCLFWAQASIAVGIAAYWAIFVGSVAHVVVENDEIARNNETDTGNRGTNKGYQPPARKQDKNIEVCI